MNLLTAFLPLPPAACHLLLAACRLLPAACCLGLRQAKVVNSKNLVTGEEQQ